MKKMSLCSALLLLTATASAQQSETAESHWSVTPKVGMTASTFEGDDATDNRNSLAWGCGLEASCRISKLLSLDMGALYVRNRIKSVEEIHLIEDQLIYLKDHQWMMAEHPMNMDHFRMKTENINFPLMLGLHPIPNLTLNAGLQMNVLLSAQESYHIYGWYYELRGIGSISIEDVPSIPKVNVDSQYSEGAWKAMRKVSFDVPVGVSYSWDSFVIDARYHFGMNHVANGKHANRRYLMLSLGYRLPL